MAPFLLVSLALATAGCPAGRQAGGQAASTPAPTAAPEAESTGEAPPLPGHGDVLWGGDAAANVTATLELPADTIEYVDGPEYGLFRVRVAEKGLQDRVLEELRKARGDRDGKLWRVEFHDPDAKPGSGESVLRTEELRG